MKKQVVLAFSGGLDTSFCVIHLREQGYEVTTVTVDTGGFRPEELKRIEGLSPKLGAKAHRTLDARSELFQGYLRYLVYGNVLRGQLYPLSVSAERVCQAAAVVDLAKRLGAGFADTLGVSIEGLARGAGNAARGVGDTIRKLFGK